MSTIHPTRGPRPNPEKNAVIYDKFFTLIKETGMTIMEACDKLSYTHAQMHRVLTEEQRRTLKSMRLGRAYRKALEERPHEPVAAPPEPPTPSTIVEFPKIVYRSEHKLRFFLRVEADKWWVTGYETPDNVRDRNLYEMHLDMRDALIKLRSSLNVALEGGAVDPDHGTTLVYSLVPQRCIQSSTVVDVPDGVYEGMVKGDIGSLTAGDARYQFALPEEVERLTTQLVVKGKVVFVYVNQ